MKDRPETTLFMLVSVDGKISTGDSDVLDVDKDFPKISGLKEGLQQYYELEQQTDLVSLNTGRVFAKVGINKKTDEPQKLPVSFVVIDNKPHLDKNGITYLAKKTKTLYIVTTNPNHPAFEVKKEFSTIEILKYENEIDLGGLLKRLKQEYNVDRITIQSGGILNASWVREGLIDHVSVVVAPALIGGKDTSTLIDGESLHTQEELSNIKALKLTKCDLLKDSYLHLQYDVIN